MSEVVTNAQAYQGTKHRHASQLAHALHHEVHDEDAVGWQAQLQQHIGDRQYHDERCATHRLIFLHLARGLVGNNHRIGTCVYQRCANHDAQERDGILRHGLQPHPQYKLRLEEDGQGEEEEQEEREAGTAEHQLVHLLHLTLGIRLRNLRIKSHLEIAHKLLDGILHIHSHASGCIDHRTEEDIEQHVESLTEEDSRKIAEHAPTCKARHLPKEGLIPHAPVFRFLEMAVAIDAVAEADEHLHQEDQHGIYHEFVERRHHQHIDDGELQHCLQDGDIGERRHALVCDDTGVVGHAHYHDHRADDGALQHPEGGIHAVCRYLHLFVKEPHAYGLAEQHDDAGDERVYLERGAEHRGEPLLVAPAQGEGDVPLRGGGHGAVDEAEHRHDAAHHIIYTVVFHPEGVEHHPARIERDAHHKEHAEIQ